MVELHDRCRDLGMTVGTWAVAECEQKVASLEGVTSS